MNENKICPKCGSTNTSDHSICINDKFASTYPIKHNWRCHDCGWDDRKPKTNFDKVRKMSADEMVCLVDPRNCPPPYQNMEACPHPQIECSECWVVWLNKEVEE